MRLIALAGRAGSGKNTVADMLCLSTESAQVSFAEPLKRLCQEVFAFTNAQMFGPSAERNRPDHRYPRPCDYGLHQGDGRACPACRGLPQYLTPRYALQTLGTGWGRSCYPNVWAELGVRRALASPAPLAVITDCRFVNEARAVRHSGGEVWRIVRPGAGLTGAAALHPSEAEQEGPEFLALVTRTIQNSGSLDELRALLIRSRSEI